MSPLIGQVPVNTAVEMMRVGVGRWKRERQNERERERKRKKERIHECLLHRERGNKYRKRATVQNSVQPTLVTDRTSGAPYPLGQVNKLF